ncbi:unnamed protein product [Boreogadus saida]
MSRKKLAWANKEVETFVCILGEEDVVYDVYVAAAAIDIRPTTKGTVGSGNATSELSWAISPPPYRTFAIRSVPHPAVETRHMARFHCRVRNGSDRKGAGRVAFPPPKVGVTRTLPYPFRPHSRDSSVAVSQQGKGPIQGLAPAGLRCLIGTGEGSCRVPALRITLRPL